jgi:membrane fusion protein (multidrug efflux system)
VAEGRAVRVKVEVGQRRDGKAEVVSGLSAGDVVVAAGQQRLRDGVPVAVKGGDSGAAASAAKAREPAKAEGSPAKADGPAAPAARS